MNNSKDLENLKVVFSFVSDREIKHFSFDFWDTIAFSNSSFKKERAQYISERLNINVSFLSVDSAFRGIGQRYNRLQEAGNGIIPAGDLLSEVLIEIGASVSQDELQDMCSDIESLFMDFPPLIDESFEDVLDAIVASGRTCSITSNTAFIQGKTLRQLLIREGLYDKLSFCIFSDEVGFSKPSREIYEQVYLSAKSLNDHLKISEIIHFGDNEVTDLKGASLFGFRAHLFSAKGKLLNPRHAVHPITNIDRVPFSNIEYSKFKFGDSYVAQKYGCEMFEYFQKIHLPELLLNHRNFLIFSSPYAQIPTASYYLAKYFYDAFTEFIEANQCSDVNLEFRKIIRSQTYTDDYGALTADQRFRLIKNDTYELIEIPQVYQVSIFIDDISITGAHQKVIEKLLTDNGSETVRFFLYYAKLDNPHVCPSFENQLNYAFTSDLNRLMEIIFSDTFKINTRTIKYILSLSQESLEYFISQVILREMNSLLKMLVSLSYANDYNKIERYQPNIEILSIHLDESKEFNERIT